MSDSDLPFTQLIDLVNNQSYPLESRTRAASQAKLLIQKAINKHCGSLIGVGWMQAMVARQIAESPVFAQIWNDAPIG